eukprot:55329_1
MRAIVSVTTPFIVLVTLLSVTCAVCFATSSKIPRGCVVWFDGCNRCRVGPNDLLACTRRFCDDSSLRRPRCLKFEARKLNLQPVCSKDEECVRKECDGRGQNA